ncbi:hypothetical protein NESM_000152200 [Novymonas esmeraldas]|uniref:Uncharacterized protein n=1 Tax=Novymonas esmeraldas TaxID=1808958 RepID=A0AAW0F3U9_9TRYP
MTTAVESEVPAASRASVAACGGPTRAATASPRAAPASARGAHDTAAGLWFFSQTRRELERHDGDDGGAAAPASPYGVAAQALRRRTRPGPTTYGTIAEFELDAPAAMHTTMATIRQQSQGRRPQRSGAARVTSTHASPRSTTASPRGVDSAAVAGDYVARLESRLAECDMMRSPVHPKQQRGSWQYQRSMSLSAGALPTPRRPDARRGSRPRPPLASTTPGSARVVALTEAWVEAEEEKRGAESRTETAAAADSFLEMPAHRALPSRAGQPSTDTCVARLRECKFRPFSAPTPPVCRRADAATTTTAAVDASAQPPWRQRLLAEPIQSYRVLKDAVEAPVPPTPSGEISLFGSARTRRGNLEKLRHGFQHQRFRLHGELEDRLEWRTRCRSAVLRRKSGEGGGPVSAIRSPATAPSSPHAAHVSALRASLLADVFAGGIGAAARQRQRQRAAAEQASPAALRSVWSREAARQAVQQEKGRLVALLQSFVVTCSAAALTLVAMEELRAETIRRVWHPEDGAEGNQPYLFYREQFLTLLRDKYDLQFSTLLSATNTVRPADTIDALPSQAEASFAWYAYETLPSRIG